MLPSAMEMRDMLRLRGETRWRIIVFLLMFSFAIFFPVYSMAQEAGLISRKKRIKPIKIPTHEESGFGVRSTSYQFTTVSGNNEYGFSAYGCYPDNSRLTLLINGNGGICEAKAIRSFIDESLPVGYYQTKLLIPKSCGNLEAASLDIAVFGGKVLQSRKLQLLELQDKNKIKQIMSMRFKNKLSERLSVKTSVFVFPLKEGEMHIISQKDVDPADQFKSDGSPLKLIGESDGRTYDVGECAGSLGAYEINHKNYLFCMFQDPEGPFYLSGIFEVSKNGFKSLLEQDAQDRRDYDPHPVLPRSINP